MTIPDPDRIAQELTDDEAWRKLEVWLFRECNAGTRRHLWAMFGLPLDEIRNHGHERHCLRYVRDRLLSNKGE